METWPREVDLERDIKEHTDNTEYDDNRITDHSCCLCRQHVTERTSIKSEGTLKKFKDEDDGDDDDSCCAGHLHLTFVLHGCPGLSEQLWTRQMLFHLHIPALACEEGDELQRN